MLGKERTRAGVPSSSDEEKLIQAYRTSSTKFVDVHNGFPLVAFISPICKSLSLVIYLCVCLNSLYPSSSYYNFRPLAVSLFVLELTLHLFYFAQQYAGTVLTSICR